MNGFSTSLTVVLKNLENSLNGNTLKGHALLTIKNNSVEFSPLSFDKLLNGEFYLVVFEENLGGQSFMLNNPPTRQKFLLDNPLLSKDLCAAVLCKYNGKTTAVCYGKVGSCKIKIGELIEQCAKTNGNLEKDISQEAKPLLLPNQGNLEKKEYFSPGEKLSNEIYNDEQIASENYFEIYKNSQKEREQYEQLHNQADCAFHKLNPEKQKEENESSSPRYDATFGACKEHSTESFYNKISDKIEDIFAKCPPISALSHIIPKSRWVKAPYAKDKFYTLGLIEEDGEMRYIVYAVEGTYGQAPKGFEANAHFIPQSIFAPFSSGYWCIFQCAKSGKRV